MPAQESDQPVTPTQMTRLTLVGDDATEETVVRVYAEVRESMPNISNLYRTLANAPTLLEAWIEFAWKLRSDAMSDRGIRELIIMRTSQVNATDYQWYPHWSMAIQGGISEAKLRALAVWQDSELFSEAERSVLAMADELADTATITDKTWSSLRSAFSEKELLELVLTAAWYGCVSRVRGRPTGPTRQRLRGDPAPMRTDLLGALQVSVHSGQDICANHETADPELQEIPGGALVRLFERGNCV